MVWHCFECPIRKSLKTKFWCQLWNFRQAQRRSDKDFVGQAQSQTNFWIKEKKLYNYLFLFTLKFSFSNHYITTQYISNNCIFWFLRSQILIVLRLFQLRDSNAKKANFLKSSLFILIRLTVSIGERLENDASHTVVLCLNISIVQKILYVCGNACRTRPSSTIGDLLNSWLLLPALIQKEFLFLQWKVA